MYVALAQALGVSVERWRLLWRTKIGSENWPTHVTWITGGIRSISSKAYRRIVLRALVEGLLTQDKANKLLAGELNENRSAVGVSEIEW